LKELEKSEGRRGNGEGTRWTAVRAVGKSGKEVKGGSRKKETEKVKRNA